jgi:hypothetical protein
MKTKTVHPHTIHVSTRYRWVENAHIFLWLIKDTCWALVWKPGGIFMIFPTLSVAFYILWESRHIRAEMFHNLAVCFWIAANSVWMVGEFFTKETRPYAIVLFVCGLITLLIYYLFFFASDKRKDKEYTLVLEDGKL